MSSADKQIKCDFDKILLNESDQSNFRSLTLKRERFDDCAFIELLSIFIQTTTGSMPLMNHDAQSKAINSIYFRQTRTFSIKKYKVGYIAAKSISIGLRYSK